MIERKMRWYHYIMLPLWAQAVIVAGAVMLAGLQIVVYLVIQENIVKFDGECEVTVGPTNEDGSVYKGARMMCGDESVRLGHLEAPYLFYMLTEGEAPAIVCVKTETEYLKEISWSCEFEEENA
jgi:hypothetical protein